jgi:CopG family nickel-responsive transcriptional regulator
VSPLERGGVVAEKLVRFGVTVPQNIIEEFDRKIERAGKTNRSDVLRQLMRTYITEERWRDETGEIYGTITLMYDHHLTTAQKELIAVQHDHGSVIVCTTHVHVSHSVCMECVILHGESQKIRLLIEALEQVRGIKSIEINMSSGI